MLKLIRFTLLWPLMAFTFFIGIIHALFFPFKIKNNTLIKKIIRRIGRFMGFEYDIKGQENFPEGSCIIVSNHTNNWDMFPVCEVAPDSAVSLGKHGLIYIPLFGQYFWLSGNILIKRGNRTKSIQSMEKINLRLKKETMSIWIFPEGTRSWGAGLLPFKKGAFVTAIETGLPIIPVCFHNYHGKLNFSKKVSGRIRITILPPIDTCHLPKNNVDQLREQVYEVMWKILKE